MTTCPTCKYEIGKCRCPNEVKEVIAPTLTCSACGMLLSSDAQSISEHINFYCPALKPDFKKEKKKCWRCEAGMPVNEKGQHIIDGDVIAKCLSQKDDKVNHPSHYTFGKFEVIDVIEDWGLDFRLANVIKYIARAPHKGKELQDLKKAQWYLNRYLEKEHGHKS